MDFFIIVSPRLKNSSVKIERFLLDRRTNLPTWRVKKIPMTILNIRKLQKMIVTKVKVNSSHFKDSFFVPFQSVCVAELGSEEESGKDWSDLEREAAEEDNKDEYAHNSHKSKKSDRDRDRHDKHKSKNNHR